MPPRLPDKDPGDTRLYTVDFSKLLLPGVILISGGVTFVTPVTIPPLSLDGAAAATDTRVTFRLAVGLAGTLYRITTVAGTSDNQEFERDVLLKVVNL